VINAIAEEKGGGEAAPAPTEEAASA